ncbi:uncharacterized protein LOC135928520 [Gordionus sp. m RMFG-2023]|uniref:uncharacterized protein LOC135928520 n=1 Tax=Gordionus sp. m RMFG-2023 TaxID=3053472 RepID=UPI0031FCDAD1
MYLDKVYSEEKVNLTLEIFNELKRTFITELNTIDWLDLPSRNAIISKITKMTLIPDQPDSIVEDLATLRTSLKDDRNVTYQLGSRIITSDQVFFMALAQEFCEIRSPLIASRPELFEHLPSDIRINDLLLEYGPFLEAWHCGEKYPTQYSPHRCSLW